MKVTVIGRGYVGLVGGACMTESSRIFGGNPRQRYADNGMDALYDADGLGIVTEWKEFRRADLGSIKSALKIPANFDGRNLYDPKILCKQGIRYFPVGR
jgi:UDPglucose 6-dehydrogenase